MKTFLKNSVQKILAGLAKLILHKYEPQIVGVTGSIGKTSAKEAIFTVLSNKFNVRRNIKNYNNEIGLPLTIIGANSGGRSAWGWAGVLAKAFHLLVWRDKNYPEILILEMAVDRPGDMAYLTDLAPCKVGVVTFIGPVHLEYFGTIEKIAKEKSVMVSHLSNNGWAVLNCDNEYAYAMKEVVKGRTIAFGINNAEADLRALEVNFSKADITSAESETALAGLNFKLAYGGAVVPVLLPNILGEHLIYAALAGAAVGIIFGMNLLEISQALRAFKAPKGRMNLIAGIKDSHLIDDTYNASPDSTAAAISALGRIEAAGGRKFAVLGDMLELGSYTIEAHEKIGAAVVQNKIDFLIAVGERARAMAAEAERLGLDSDHVFTFSDAQRAGLFLQDKIENNDYILIKGSQGMRMEKITKELMAEPLRAQELLVRQDEIWLKS